MHTLLAHLKRAASDLTLPAPPGWRRRVQPDGVLWFARRTGLNVLVDEVQHPPQRWTRAPRTVQWSLWDACDLDCAFCYAPKDGARWAPEDLLALAQGLDRWGVMELAFAGGEPTLYPDITALLARIWDTTGLAVHLTTHGLRVPDDFAARLRGKLGQVRVSIDGVGDAYTRLRGAPFGQLLDGLERLRGLRLGFNAVVSDALLDAFPAWVALALAHDARDVLLLRPFGPGAGMLPDRARARLRDAINYAQRHGLRVRGSCAWGSLGLDTLHPARPCGAGRDMLHITSDRRVKAASLSAHAWRFDTLDDLRAVYDGPLRRKLDAHRGDCWACATASPPLEAL